MRLRIFLLFFYTTSYSQPETFKNNTLRDKYYIENVINVTDGKGENVNVKFVAIIPLDAWDTNVKKSNMSDKEFLQTIVDNLSASAREGLKSPQSFSPFAKEIILWSGSDFTCDYQLSGKNAYGGTKETNIYVRYIPNANPLETGLPKRHKVN